MYCFRRFFLKCVLVCDNPFSTTVAVTLTKSGCTNGVPISEKSFAPANKTLSNRNLSPMLGGQ